MVKISTLAVGAGTRSRIQARLSGMNIHNARTSKLVSDFLSLEWALVTNSAHAAHVPARLQATWAELARRGGLSDQKIKKGTFVRIEKISF